MTDKGETFQCAAHGRNLRDDDGEIIETVKLLAAICGY
jgi:hypothetical protein